MLIQESFGDSAIWCNGVHIVNILRWKQYFWQRNNDNICWLDTTIGDVFSQELFRNTT